MPHSRLSAFWREQAGLPSGTRRSIENKGEIGSCGLTGNENSRPVSPQTGDTRTGHPAKRFPLLPAYDLCLRCSHLFNILDARGAISVTERVGVIARVRALAVGIARAWVDQQKGQVASPEKSDEGEPVREKKTKKEKLLPAAI